MSQYSPKLWERLSRNIKVELDLSNYATKADLKGATWVDTSNLEVKWDLPSLKAQVDKIDVEKLKTVPTNSKNTVKKNFKTVNSLLMQ